MDPLGAISGDVRLSRVQTWAMGRVWCRAPSLLAVAGQSQGEAERGDLVPPRLWQVPKECSSEVSFLQPG